MTKIAYFDCFHGAAGDMLLASLLDAGVEQHHLEDVLATVPITGYRIEHQHISSHHIAGSRVTVHITEQQPARTWADIRTLLETSRLPQQTRTWALGAFSRLAHAEATVHGTTPDEVHFHEVGAVDSIVDMVGVCAALELLGIEQVYVSALPTGSGWVATQHGMLPVPAPATLEIVAHAHVPIVAGASTGELLTPTAAALLAEVAFGNHQPAMCITSVGYGFGHTSFDRLNGVRVWIGSLFDTTHGHHHHHHHMHEQAVADHHHHHHHMHEQAVADHHHHHHHSHSDEHTTHTPDDIHVVEICCNVDDCTGEVIGYTIEQLLHAGALDAWAAPLVMKKGRPGMQLCCLAPNHLRDELATLMMQETSTFGVRWHTDERMIAKRQVSDVDTEWGLVPLKHKLVNGTIVASSPEYDVCAELARRHQVPLATIYAAAHDAYHQHVLSRA